MADETTTTWAKLLREAKGPLVEALRYKTVLLSEIQRDTNPRRWQGKQVTVPIFLAPQQGTSMITETGTLNTPITSSVDQAIITSATIAVAISFTPQLMKQSTSGDGGWADVVPTKMSRAEEVFKRVINEQMCGQGGSATAGAGALLSACTATNNNSTTVSVGTTANFYQLYPGRVVDVLTRASGTPVTSGAGRSIVTTNPTAGTLVVDTAITTTNAEGIYIQGSYGNALQGVGGAVGTSGNFQSLSKTTNQAWQGTDVTPGAVTDPSIAVLDKAERFAYQNSGKTPAFYISDPAVVDKYSQGLTVQARWAGEEGTLASGWSGIRYRDKLLVPEFDMPSQTIYGIDPDSCAIYTLMDGPDWDDLAGSVFQRFGTRALPVEAWLVWMLQFGFHSCNTFVKIGNMTQAT